MHVGLSILLTMTLALAHLKEDRQTELSLQSVPEAIAIAEQQQKLDSLRVSKASSFSTRSVLEEFLFLIYRPRTATAWGRCLAVSL